MQDRTTRGRQHLTIYWTTKEIGGGLFAVAIRSIANADGVVIGKGITRKAALLDAQTYLQSALDAVDVAIVKGEPAAVQGVTVE